MTTQAEDLAGLTQLGQQAGPSRRLESFPHHQQDGHLGILLDAAEFSCLCPLTGQPDFARIQVRYVPDQKVLESKSFKLYLWSFRDQGIFHEHVVGQMLEDLDQALQPHAIRVIGHFNPRGGIGITVSAQRLRTPDALAALERV